MESIRKLELRNSSFVVRGEVRVHYECWLHGNRLLFVFLGTGSPSKALLEFEQKVFSEGLNVAFQQKSRDPDSRDQPIVISFLNLYFGFNPVAADPDAVAAHKKYLEFLKEKSKKIGSAIRYRFTWGVLPLSKGATADEIAKTEIKDLYETGRFDPDKEEDLAKLSGFLGQALTINDKSLMDQLLKGIGKAVKEFV